MCNEAELATDFQLPSISAYDCNLALDRSIEILQSCNLKKKTLLKINLVGLLCMKGKNN